MAKQKIIIIGSGPVGLACAIHALENGDDVSIFHKSSMCAGIAAGGMLAPSYEFLGKESEEFTDFAFKSHELWNDLAAQLDVEIIPNCLVLGNNEDTNSRLEKLLEFGVGRQFNFAKTNVPQGFNAVAALNLNSDGLINPIFAISAFKSKIKAMGGEFFEIEQLEIGQNNIFADNKEFAADKIIISAGVGAKIFSKIIPSLANIYGVRGQIIEYATKAKFHGSVRCGSTYILARGDKTIVGATAHQNVENWDIEQGDIETLRQNAIKLCPELENAEITNSFCGVRPASKDGLPIIGNIEGTNISLACAPFRNGWLLAPAIAKMVFGEEDYTQYSKAFSPLRFK